MWIMVKTVSGQFQYMKLTEITARIIRNGQHFSGGAYFGSAQPIGMLPYIEK